MRVLLVVLLVLCLAVGALAQDVTTTPIPLLTPDSSVQTQFAVPYQLDWSGDASLLAALSVNPADETASATALQLFDADGIREITQDAYQFALHPILPQLVTTSFSGDVTVWDTTTGTQISTVKGHESAADIAYAPDGQTYVTADYSGVILWSGMSNEPTFFLPSGNTTDDLTTRLAISADSQYVAWVDMPATVIIAALATGEIVARVATQYEVEPYKIGFTPDNQLALGYGSLELWDIGTQTRLALIVTQEAVRDFAWSDDATRLAILESDGIVRVFDSATQQVQFIASAGVPAWSLAWQPGALRLTIGFENNQILTFPIP